MAATNESDNPLYQQEVEEILRRQNPSTDMRVVVERHGQFLASLADAQPGNFVLRTLRKRNKRPVHPLAAIFHYSQIDLRTDPGDPERLSAEAMTASHFFKTQQKIAEWIRCIVEPYRPTAETPPSEAPGYWSDRFPSIKASVNVLCDFPEGELHKSILAIVEHDPTGICWMARFPLPLSPDHHYTSLSFSQNKNWGYKTAMIEHSNLPLTAREILTCAVGLVNKKNSVQKTEPKTKQTEVLNEPIF